MHYTLHKGGRNGQLPMQKGQIDAFEVTHMSVDMRLGKRLIYAALCLPIENVSRLVSRIVNAVLMPDLIERRST